MLIVEIVMLSTLLERYKSKRLKYHFHYERYFYEDRLKPFLILQVGIESSLQVWQKYFQKSLIYCIDTFNNIDPKDISYLEEKRIYWARCDVNDKKQLNHVMKNIWNNPRFDIIIDNTNQYDNFRRYCIGKYYIEKNDKVMKI